jgi:hypothetical protein
MFKVKKSSITHLRHLTPNLSQPYSLPSTTEHLTLGAIHRKNREIYRRANSPQQFIENNRILAVNYL